MLGIRQVLALAADQVAASNALADATGMSFSLGANAKAKIDFWLPFVVGATGGYKFRFDYSGVAAKYNLGYTVIDGVTATANVESAVIVAKADISSAWAVAGNFNFYGSLYIVGAATPGTVKLQIAQNSTDALTLTLLAGAYMDVAIL